MNFYSFKLFLSISLFCLVRSTRSVSYINRGHQILAFIPRGGAESPDGVNNHGDTDGTIASSTTSFDEMQQFIGILDLRPEPDPDSIILLHDGRGEHIAVDHPTISIDVAQEALFPTSTATAGSDDAITSDVANEEAELDQQAASSHSIGSLCSKVYLIIAYDFANGKTVLHRSFGGAKLMAFIDGVRSRFHDNLGEMDSQPSGVGPTELILLLAPSPSSSAKTMFSNFPSAGVAPENNLLSDISSPLPSKVVLDLKMLAGKDYWDSSGANFLVDRLSEAFALGGEKFQTVDPFAIEMIGVFDERDCYETEVDEEIVEKKDSTISSSANEMRETIVRHIVCSRRDEQAEDATIQTNQEISFDAEKFQDLINQTYEAAGGVDSVDFQ